jgi:exosortase D (VPLPA-CTERM-specific)
LKTRQERRGFGWSGLLLLVLLAWVYAPIMGRLAEQWWHDPNFSHGPFVPLFSLYVLWQERARLRALPKCPSWTGIWLILFGFAVLISGVVGAELFLSRISLLIVLAGLVVLFFGWNHLREAAFPWAFLIFMIPIPKIIFNQITLPLQRFASVTAAHVLPFLGVPVFREGNIINLPAMPLEVAEACSGIRSLMSLATLAIIYGYLMERRKWIRVVLALAAIPIAVAANAFRIVGTGLLVQYWDPDKAEGFFHAFSGWLIFMVSLGLLLVVHRGLVWLAGSPPPESAAAQRDAQPLHQDPDAASGHVGPWRFILVILLIMATGGFLKGRAETEIIPAREQLAAFPHQMGDWNSVDVPIENSIREVLGPGDFLLREYQRIGSNDPATDLFIAYFPSQRAGDTMHSPQNCLPGSGWAVLVNHRIKLAVSGSPAFPVNQYVVTRGADRQLVLYWYFAHNRAVASEYRAKWYLVVDAIRMNRSDGSLIRLNTIMLPGETVDSAMNRLVQFASEVVPRLGTFIPR